MKQVASDLINKDKKNGMVFRRENYVLFIIGLILILGGYVLMTGGGSEDPAVFTEEIYSFTRITLAPILVLTGFIIEIFAIMKKPKN